jgi:DNA-binding GntR family transcriptional regulator
MVSIVKNLRQGAAGPRRSDHGTDLSGEQCRGHRRRGGRQLVTAMARATDDPVWFLQVDWQLHRRIAAITQNEVMAQVYTPLVATLEQNVAQIVPDKSLPAYMQQRLRLHADLVEAIAAADTDAAAELVRQHRLTLADADGNAAHRPAVEPDAKADHIDGTS